MTTYYRKYEMNFREWGNNIKLVCKGINKDKACLRENISQVRTKYGRMKNYRKRSKHRMKESFGKQEAKTNIC